MTYPLGLPISSDTPHANIGGGGVTLLNYCTYTTLLPSSMSITLHTDVGDMKIELFCEECPKTCYNFLALCASDFYNDCIFHRNIKGFLCQVKYCVVTRPGNCRLLPGYYLLLPGSLSFVTRVTVFCYQRHCRVLPGTLLPGTLS